MQIWPDPRTTDCSFTTMTPSPCLFPFACVYYDPIGFSKHAISFRSILNVAIEAGVMVADVQCSAGAILGRVHVPKFKIRKSTFERVRVEMEVVARFKRSVFPRTRLDLCFKMIHFARGTDICIVSN